MNRNGFTFLTAIFMVMIIGIMLGLTGQSWKTIMKREREKELLFRGSQIKEAIENWYNPKYSVNGVKRLGQPQALMDLKDLLLDPHTLTPLRYLPHTYATELDGKNSKCAPDCAKLKIYQDPMTGKEWTLIRGNVLNGQITVTGPGIQGAGIIGVASKSDETPLKTDFKDTALENMGTVGVVVPAAIGGAAPTDAAPTIGGKMTKYSEWKFVADPQAAAGPAFAAPGSPAVPPTPGTVPTGNDHSKLYRAYHEGL